MFLKNSGLTTMNICVLIPSYNEEQAIGRIIRGLKDRYHVVVYVVDDGSTDGTAAIAESEGAVVVKHRKNKGKGASLREGFKHVLKKGFDAVMLMDGDGQHGLEDVESFLRCMEDESADIVIGNRMLDTRSMPYVRRHTNRFMSNLISRITRQFIPDSQCGFKLIKKDVLQKVNLKSSNYEIESELLIKAARAGFEIRSVPIKTVYQDEKSKINPIADTVRFIVFLMKMFLKP